MIKKEITHNLKRRFFGSLLILLLYPALGMAGAGVRAVPVKASGDSPGLSVIRDDGIRVLIRENGTYYCNTGITFLAEGAGALFEYRLRQEGGSDGAYKEMNNGTVRLTEKEYAQKEGNWIISFRARDESGKGRLLWSAGPYRICFDVTAPGAALSFEKSSIMPDTVKAGISMEDEKSGVSYAELRQEGEILYRQDFRPEDGSGSRKSAGLLRRSGQIRGKQLKLYVMDRAGNGRVVEKRYYDVPDKTVRGAFTVLRERLRLLAGKLSMPEERTLLAFYIAVSLALIGLLGELLFRLLNRIWFG